MSCECNEKGVMNPFQVVDDQVVDDQVVDEQKSFQSLDRDLSAWQGLEHSHLDQRQRPYKIGAQSL